MIFKELSACDIDLILSIQKDNFADGWNKEQLLSGFNGGNLFAIQLQIDGKTVGLITYSVSFDTADIEGVTVVGSERKKGYGKLLMAFALAQLKNKNVTDVFLEVRRSNLPAIALYSACGFNKISERKKYYSDGEDAVVMKKEI